MRRGVAGMFLGMHSPCMLAVPPEAAPEPPPSPDNIFFNSSARAKYSSILTSMVAFT